MLGAFVTVVLGLGMIGAAIVIWRSEAFAEWNWRNQASWLPSRGPFRRRSLSEARLGIRLAGLLMGIFGGFLILLVALNLSW